MGMLIFSNNFQVLGFLAFNPVDALGAVELPNGEFLLVFNTLGVFVDAQGRKSRDREIMYPAMPTDVAVCDAKLLVSYKIGKSDCMI
jgi:serine/threonine-protein kinase MRCK